MSDNFRGIVAMIISMFFFNIGDTLFKVLGDALPIGQMLLVRGIFATAMVLTYAWWSGALAHFHTVLTPIMALRTVCETACSVFFFIGLVRMSFSDVAAIGQFTPLLVMAGAAIFLNEPVGWRRWAAAAVGFLGVMLIIKPGTTAFQPIALVVLISMMFVAVRDLLTRKMPLNVPTVLITLSSAIGGMAIGPVLLPFETWRPMSGLEVGIMFVCALTVVLGYAAVILGMRFGDTAVVSPFRYAYMVFAILSSLLVFRERPDLVSWFGIVLVVGSGLYMLHREQVKRREQSTVAPIG